MAKYTYNELRSAAESGRRIGGWQGVNVYSCSKYDYDATKSHFYVLYDDGNKLIKSGQVYGTIDNAGTITECAHYWYNVPLKPGEVVVKTTAATSGYSDEVITDEFFSRIDREINELLASVGELKLSQEFTI